VIHRAQEGRLALILRLVFALPLLAVLSLNIVYPRALAWAKFSLPAGVQVAALIAAAFCVLLLWWVFRSIGDNISETVLVKKGADLVTSGPYRYVRHPLYAGSLFFLLALSLVFRDWIILGYSLAGILAFRLLVIPAEEAQLLKSFGEEYECYQSRTGVLLPWIR
jgi:protein-S-isoprenylcysteine O-methyltransferase Ste14